MTHAAWYDVIRNKVITYDVTDMPDLTDLKMEADVPWITFYNEKEKLGFAGIGSSLTFCGIGLGAVAAVFGGGSWIGLVAAVCVMTGFGIVMLRIPSLNLP